MVLPITYYLDHIILIHQCLQSEAMFKYNVQNDMCVLLLLLHCTKNRNEKVNIPILPLCLLLYSYYFLQQWMRLCSDFGFLHILVVHVGAVAVISHAVY